MQNKVYVSKNWLKDQPEDPQPDRMKTHYFFWQMVFNILAVIIIFLLVIIIFKDHHNLSPLHHHPRFEDQLLKEKLEQCNMKCTHDKSAVCGSNGLTYVNACSLSRDGCLFPEMTLVVAYSGHCLMPKSLTLVGGNGFSQGNVYARNHDTGMFGPVCDDAWNLEGAAMVCRYLGFVGALRHTTESFFGPVTPFFSFDDVKCRGFESHLQDCPHVDEADCGPGEGAGVFCDDGSGTGFVFPGYNFSLPVTTAIPGTTSAATADPNLTTSLPGSTTSLPIVTNPSTSSSPATTTTTTTTATTTAATTTTTTTTTTTVTTSPTTTILVASTNTSNLTV